MSELRRALAVLGTAAAVLLAPSAAFAHPLGNFTINTAAAIVLSPGSVRVDYAVDRAEIPTVQVLPGIDADGDGATSSSELEAWAGAQARTVVANLDLEVDGETVPLEVAAASAVTAAGQGGLEVLRLQAAFTGEVASEGALTFRDRNFEDRIGWHEVTAAGVDGVALVGSTVPATSATDGLRVYPQDLLSSPLDVRQATLSFGPGTSAPVAPAGPGAPEAARAPGGSFTGLLGRDGPLAAVALVIAFGFGALHALGPGHGKALIAAYLVGGGGRIRQAVAVGGAVAVMHTASVLGLGLVVLSATEVFAPERVYPWLGVASGLIALGLGAGLLVSRLGAWGGRRDHRHDHEYAYEHAHEHAHDHAHATSHHHGKPAAPLLSRRGLGALAVAGGILPSPTALVVLLASVAIHRVTYGLALIGAFSLGLAAALVGVGVLALAARDVVERRLSSRLARALPVASAGGIALLGVVLTLNGVAQL